jgi:hypothetical protein
VDGDVHSENPDTIGIRTGDAIYRFLRGFRGPVMASHQLFTETDSTETEQAWLTAEDLT